MDAPAQKPETEGPGQASVSVPQKDAAQTPRAFNEMALFLGGIEPGRDSEYHELTHNPAWKSYASAVESNWSRFNKTVARRVLAWRDKELADVDRELSTVFYPFGGPDILYALLLFPKAQTYVLIGLEPAGTILDPQGIPTESLDSYFPRLGKSVDEVLQLSFFRVLDLNADLTAKGLSGTLPILLLSLARTGNEIVGIRPIEITTDGKTSGLDAFPETKTGNKGVEISFRANASGFVKQLFYVSVDLGNFSLGNNPKARRFLDQRAGRSATLIKAASYLMDLRYFSKIRSAILEKSRVIVQDDSGLPYKFFDPSVWDIRLYGAYTKPIEMFKNHFQQDLKDAYAAGGRSLDFRFGYSPQPNLLVARRKS